MSLAAVFAIIGTMRAKGMSAQDILDVVEAVSAVAEVLPTRSSAAERQARYRERKQGVTRDVTRDVTVPLEVSLSPAPLSLPKTPSKNPPKGGQKGSRLSPDWQPTDADRATAAELGFPAAQAEAAFAKFRDFWIAKPGSGGVKLDWPATLRNWLRTDAERRGYAPPSPTPANRPTGPPPRIKTEAELLAELEALEAEDDAHHRSHLPLGSASGDEIQATEPRRVTRIYVGG